MGFTIVYWKNHMHKTFIAFVMLCCFSPPSDAVELLDLQQKTDAKEILITPNFELIVSQKVIDAIDNGIVITFVYQAKLFETIDWWFDAVIENKIQTFELRYFSLGNQYQLHHLNSKIKFSFITLEELLKHLGQQTTFKFKANEQANYVETRIFLDKQALPSIMQLPNVFDADWNINSDWQKITLIKTTETAK